MNRNIFETLTIKHLAQTEFLTCRPDETLRMVCSVMASHHCSSILVEADGEVIGIWTERDALKYDFSSNESGSIPVSEVMNSPVRYIDGGLSLEEASVQFMREGVRHYVVLDDGARAGVLSLTDIVNDHDFDIYLVLRTAGSIINPNLVFVEADLNLNRAIELMRNSFTDALAVNFPDDATGILTERDIIKAIASTDCQPRVGDYASRIIFSVNEHESLYRAKKIMAEKKIRHLGVTNQCDGLIGIIAFSDILSGFRSSYVSELKAALQDRDERLKYIMTKLILNQRIIDTSHEGVMITDKDMRIVYCNQSLTKITGYESSEVVGNKPTLLKSGRHAPEFYQEMWDQVMTNDYWRGEIWNRRKNGEIYPEILTITAIRDAGSNQITHYAGFFSDISKSKRREEEIRRLTFYDPLTGLPNRRLFLDRLQLEQAASIRNKKFSALLYIDLDNFRNINESLGHSAGDSVLQETAERFKVTLRESDTCARLSGDEFAIILPGLDKSLETAGSQTQAIVEKLQASLTRPFIVDMHQLVISPSIGITFFPESDESADEILKQAATAMSRAKKKGRNQIQFFHLEMQAAAIERMTLEKDLRRALALNDLELWYQPQMDCRGSLLGAEALLRWRHPERGYVNPEKFIAVAEDCGLIHELGDWVFETAFKHFKFLEKRRMKLEHMAVNVSPLQFYRQDFVEKLNKLGKRYDVDGSCITLEITENLLMNDINEAIDKMNELKKFGYQFSIDDFGTGYSSLNYLRRLPLDQLKIDKSFISNIDSDKSNEVFVDTIVCMAKHMKLDVIAEGVESREEMEILLKYNCRKFQGNFFSEPLPYERFHCFWEERLIQASTKDEKYFAVKSKF